MPLSGHIFPSTIVFIGLIHISQFSAQMRLKQKLFVLLRIKILDPAFAQIIYANISKFTLSKH